MGNVENPLNHTGNDLKPSRQLNLGETGADGAERNRQPLAQTDQGHQRGGGVADLVCADQRWRRQTIEPDLF